MSKQESTPAFCRCVLHLSQFRKYNPWAVCTNSTKRTGPVHCAPYYRRTGFGRYTLKELRGYAAQKKIAGAWAMSKDRLVRILTQIVQSEAGPSAPKKAKKAPATKARAASKGKGKVPKRESAGPGPRWTKHLETYRRAHPELTYREAQKAASRSFRALKK